MSRCAGAGREHSQPDQAGQRKYSIPWTSAQFMNGGWPGGRNLLFLISVSLNPLLGGSLNFYGSLVFFGSFVKFAKFTVFQVL